MSKLSVGVFSKIMRKDEFVMTAVESVLAQTYTNFCFYIAVGKETRAFLEPVANKDNRIVLVELENPNDGFNACYKSIASKHDFVIRMDGDDWLEPDCLEIMIGYSVANDCDVTICGNTFMRVLPGNNKICYGKREVTKSLTMTTQEALNELPMMYQFFRTGWAKLWNSKVLLDIDMLITGEKVGGYGGDTLEAFQMIQYTNRVGIVDRCLYNYRINENSESYKIKEGRLESDEVLFKYVTEVLRKYNCYTEKNMFFLYIIYMNATRDSLDLIVKTTDNTEKMIERISRILNNPITEIALGLNDAGFFNTFIEKKDVRKEWFETIILPGYLKITHDVLSEDIYPVLVYCFPYLKDILSVSFFKKYIIDSKKILQAVLNKESKQFISLVDYKKIDDEDKMIYFQILGKMINNAIYSDTLSNKEAVRKYGNILIELANQKYEKITDKCLAYIETEKNDQIRLWLANIITNIAATINNVEMFIVGKAICMRLYDICGDTEKSQLEKQDLLDMGVEKGFIDSFEI